MNVGVLAPSSAAPFRAPTLRALVVLSMCAIGCTEKKSEVKPTSAPVETAVAETPPVEPPVSASTSEPAASSAVLKTRAPLRRRPSREKQVTDAAGIQRDNQFAELERGEVVVVLNAQEMWSEVKTTTQELSGWVDSSLLVPGGESALGTVLQVTPVFTKPAADATALDKTIEPGALLVVMKSEGAFLQVHEEGGRVAWMRADDVTSSPSEVELARAVARVRWSRWNDTPSEALLKARGKHPSARLTQIFDNDAVPSVGGEDTEKGALPLERLDEIRGTWLEVSPDWSTIYIACGSEPSAWAISTSAEDGEKTLFRFVTGGQDNEPHRVDEASTNERHNRYWLLSSTKADAVAAPTLLVDMKWADRERGRMWIREPAGAWVPYVLESHAVKLRRERGECTEEDPR